MRHLTKEKMSTFHSERLQTSPMLLFSQEMNSLACWTTNPALEMEKSFPLPSWLIDGCQPHRLGWCVSISHSLGNPVTQGRKDPHPHQHLGFHSNKIGCTPLNSPFLQRQSGCAAVLDLRPKPSFIPKVVSAFHLEENIVLPTLCPAPKHPYKIAVQFLDRVRADIVHLKATAPI